MEIIVAAPFLVDGGSAKISGSGLRRVAAMEEQQPWGLQFIVTVTYDSLKLLTFLSPPTLATPPPHTAIATLPSNDDEDYDGFTRILHLLGLVWLDLNFSKLQRGPTESEDADWEVWRKLQCHGGEWKQSTVHPLFGKWCVVHHT